jgi:flagellar basal-body rod protein FlgB
LPATAALLPSSFLGSLCESESFRSRGHMAWCLLMLNITLPCRFYDRFASFAKELLSMTISFDKVLGIHPRVLELRSRRAEVIAANLANQDTPGYLAKDMDFRTAFASVQGKGALQLTHTSHLQPAGSASGELLYRVPTQSAIDGNTVDEQQEKAAFADNALRYQASLRFLSNRIRGLLSAIRGE